ncbi:MAG: hypothetical protein EOO05_09310 [Chitinophagaceae bacterium]|nr:MAG: hypothetical protein EOO05_09310 [Chitinophagaceae bacterium]
MLAMDPAIAANLFDVEIYPWYGSAALPMYLPFHKKIEKKKPQSVAAIFKYCPAAKVEGLSG